MNILKVPSPLIAEFGFLESRTVPAILEAGRRWLLKWLWISVVIQTSFLCCENTGTKLDIRWHKRVKNKL